MNTISTIQTIINKGSKVKVVPYPLQPTKLKIWYKFNGNLTNSAPNFTGSNNGIVVSANGGSQVQSNITPALPNGNTKTPYMNTFNGGGTSSGINTYINLGTITNLILTQGFTICFWIYSIKSTGGDSYILALNNSGISGGNYAGGFTLGNPSALSYTKYIFNNYNGNYFTMSLNQWNHVTITINSSNIYNVYVNSSNVLLNNTNPYAYPTSTSWTANSFGSYSPTGPHNSLNGNVSDFRFYNTVLTTTEIASIYNGTA